MDFTHISRNCPLPMSAKRFVFLKKLGDHKGGHSGLLQEAPSLTRLFGDMSHSPKVFSSLASLCMSCATGMDGALSGVAQSVARRWVHLNTQNDAFN